MATENSVSRSDPGTLVVTGPLVFTNAAHALASAREVLREGHHECLDLGGVTAVDSAGMACVLAIMADACQRGDRLRVVHAPAGLTALARVCDVAPLLAGA